MIELLKREKETERPCPSGGDYPYPCTLTCPCAMRDALLEIWEITSEQPVNQYETGAESAAKLSKIEGVLYK